MTTYFKFELKRLEEAREEADRQRKMETDAADALAKVEADADAARHRSLLEQMLTQQVDEAKVREDRRKFMSRYILGPTGLLTAVGAALVGYLEMTAAPKVESKDVSEKVEAAQESSKIQVEEIEAHLKANDLKINRTVDILLDQQVQQSDGHDDIVMRIGIAHPRTRKVDEPPSVTRGRAKASAIKAAREGKPSYDPSDPLAGLK